MIVELKQWIEAQVTTKDAIVRTFINQAQREVSHPSYQAWSYAALLEDFNESVRDIPIQLKPCAYLHNCESDKAISNEFYRHHLDRAPVFLKDDALKLKEFIKKYVRYGYPSHIKELEGPALSLIFGHWFDQRTSTESSLRLAQIVFPHSRVETSVAAQIVFGMRH